MEYDRREGGSSESIAAKEAAKTKASWNVGFFSRTPLRTPPGVRNGVRNGITYGVRNE